MDSGATLMLVTDVGVSNLETKCVGDNFEMLVTVMHSLSLNINVRHQPGAAGRGRPSWDGDRRRTVKDGGRKIFLKDTTYLVYSNAYIKSSMGDIF